MITESIPFISEKIVFSKNDTIRIKVTNRCPFQCNFCHHEGNINGKDLILDDYLIEGLNKCRAELNLSQIHLTGGEPASYPFCTAFIRKAVTLGFTVKMTSNGQFPSGLLEELKDAGLHGINFSIHTLNPIKLGALQFPPKNFEWGIRALENQLKNLMRARAIGLSVKINTVVQNDSDIIDIINFCKSENIALRILDDLNPHSLSVQRIIEILSSMKSIVDGTNLFENASGYSYDITSGDGFKFKVKGIRKHILRSLCGDCRVRDDCKEWFYGIRLEQSEEKAVVRLCLHRQGSPAVQTFEEFFSSGQFLELQGKK